MAYGQITKYEIAQYKMRLEEKMYNAIKHINNMIIEDRRVVFSLDTLSCIEESCNFGIDVYIESSATIKYSAFDVDSLEEVDFGCVHLTDENCYSVGYCKNVFNSINDIVEAIICEVEQKLSCDKEEVMYDFCI